MMSNNNLEYKKNAHRYNVESKKLNDLIVHTFCE